MPRNEHNSCRPLPPLAASDIARFWKYVDVRGPDECWPWKMYAPPDGHGRFMVNKKPVRASRVAYFLTTGKDPYPLLICHDCPVVDNPRCCNPSHLYPGTDSDNMWDRVEKGTCPMGEAHWAAILTAEKVIAIRALWDSGHHTAAQIGSQFSINPRLVRKIGYRQRWKHIPG